MLLQMAWRNIWRNRKRSLIMVSAISIGLSAGIFLMAFYNGMIEQRVKNAIQSEISHIQIHHPSFREDHDIQFYLDNGSTILGSLSANKSIQQATGRLVIMGMIASPAGSSGIQITGVMSETESRVTGLDKKMTGGTYLSAPVKNRILISESLQKKLRLKIGAKTILSFQDLHGEIVSAAFRISGTFKTANKPYDESHVFVNLRDLDSIAGLTGKMNEIALYLRSGDEVENVQSTLKRQYPSLEILNWREISPEIGLTVSVADQMVLIFLGIILLALAFGIINTMLMSILERTRELGMLLALGMNRSKVFMMIVLETICLVLAGCPAGIAIAYTAIGTTQHSGISFSQFADVYESFGYDSVIYPVLSGYQLINSMAMVIITALVAGIFPAWRVLRLQPAGAMSKY